MKSSFLGLYIYWENIAVISPKANDRIKWILRNHWSKFEFLKIHCTSQKCKNPTVKLFRELNLFLYYNSQQYYELTKLQTEQQKVTYLDIV